MSAPFEELAFGRTSIGDLSLRRRTELSLDIDVFEIKLGDEFLMSSLFTEGEVQLAKLGLQGFDDGLLDVAVAGLGLGYTTQAALDQPDVRSVLVVEALPEIIKLHRSGLVPLGERLSAEPRCYFAQGDFFGLVNSPAQGLDIRNPGRRFDAILVDIDHSPRHVLNTGHDDFYEIAGLGRLREHLRPRGVFALWSNEPPDEKFLEALNAVFAESRAHVVEFRNHLQGRNSTNTVYVARRDT